MTEARWSEANSAEFVELGAVATPWRGELAQAFLALIPAGRDEPFAAVDLCAGTGWLTEAILEAFPRASVLAVDGSPTMLAETEWRLARFDNRLQARTIELEDEAWLPALQVMPRAIVSCLAIHHLDAAGKRRLYRQAFERLDEGGALLVADLVAHQSDAARQYWAREWKRDAQAAGDAIGFERFVSDGWNYFDESGDPATQATIHPGDDIDRPSGLGEQLTWLREIGFGGVDCFWLRAGHALYGGYRGAASSRV